MVESCQKLGWRMKRKERREEEKIKERKKGEKEVKIKKDIQWIWK